MKTLNKIIDEVPVSTEGLRIYYRELSKEIKTQSTVMNRLEKLNEECVRKAKLMNLDLKKI